MENSIKILSDITVHMKYAKFLPNKKRRETWEELCYRNRDMHLNKYPELSIEIINLYNNFIIPKKVLPSMRSLQFAGRPIELAPSRMYNCSYLPVDDYRAFSETMFMLLGGNGVGFSVQSPHIAKLPDIKLPTKKRRFVVADSIEGWSDAVKMLMKSYLYGASEPIFDFRDIRPKGAALITSGGKAPGPKPLEDCLFKIKQILKVKENGDRLSSIEVHDIFCHIADAVLAGGIRRAALISFFDFDDSDMLSCKSGSWWELNPQRGRANNSAVFVRHKVKNEDFDRVFEMTKASGSGEPGIMFTNDYNILGNPCVTGDTEILTDNGYEKIENLVDQKVNVWNGFEWSEVEPKVTGKDQEVLTITFSDGRVLNCTKYHNFHIAKGYHGDSDIVQAKDLEIGMKLIKHEFPIIEHGRVLEDAYTQGFVSAEGMELNKSIYIYKPKECCIPRLQNLNAIKWEENNNRFRGTLKNIPVSKNLVPLDYNLHSKLEWLSGLFDGDGCELREGGLQLVSVNRLFLKQLQSLLSTIGVQSKITLASLARNRVMPDHRGGNKEFYCQEAHRVLIGAVQMQQLIKLGLKCERLKFEKTPQRDASQFVKIVGIEESGVADTVYCFTEPKRNLGVFNGVLTGQCNEISLKPFQFCNLVEVNASDINSQEELESRVKAGALLGTLQAGFTDFHYLRDIWKKTTEKEALLGVSMTGIASGKVLTLDLNKAAKEAVKVNRDVSKKIGINPAARITTVKPAGTTSLVLGSSSGIHAWHNPHFIRRIRVGKNEAIYKYLVTNHPNLVKDEYFRPDKEAVIEVPVKAPEGSIYRNESAMDMLNRIKLVYNSWILGGHVKGDNTHNISATVSVADNEWDTVKSWMWDNRNSYNGISLLPLDTGSYIQAPYEDITEDQYNNLVKDLEAVDLSKIIEDTDDTNLSGEIACSGNSCEIK